MRTETVTRLLAALGHYSPEIRLVQIQKWRASLSLEERHEATNLVREGRGDPIRAESVGLSQLSPEEEARLWASPLLDLYLTRAVIALA